MSFKTVEVELEDGRVRPSGTETLPVRAHALLTILEANVVPLLSTANRSPAAGLRRFLSTPDFPLTPEQFRTSMESDFFDQ